MKLEIQVKTLVNLMALVKPVLPKKATIEAIKFIRVGDGKAVATDLETMVITDLPEAQEPMLLPYSDLSDILKYIPDGILKIELNKKELTLVWEGGSATYPTLDAADFPVLPEMEMIAEGSLNGDTLIPALGAALPYAATEEDRPVLHGVTLTLGNPVEVAAGDGFRMSHQLMGMSFPSEERIVLPWRSVYLLGYIFAKTPRTPPPDSDSLISVITAKKQVYISLLKGKSESQKIRFDFGSTSVIINPVAGSPPAFIQLIPKEEPIMQSQVFAPHLEASVKRVRAIAKDGSGAVRLEFAEGKLTVSSYAGDKEVKTVMDVLVTQGEPNRFGLNYPYLLDFLSDKKGIITISKHTDIGPVVFDYGSPQRILIMPMDIKWDDEKKPAAEEEADPATESETNEVPEGNLGGPEETTEEEPGEEETEEAVGKEEPITTD